MSIWMISGACGPAKVFFSFHAANGEDGGGGGGMGGGGGSRCSATWPGGVGLET